MTRRIVLARLASAAVCGAFYPLVRAADDFPNREIRVMIGYSPGSASELSLRALVKSAQKYLKPTLVILNRPGGNQAIALSVLAQSPADGYTIAMTTDTFISLTRHQQKLSFDADLLYPLLGYTELQQVLFVRADNPSSTFKDFVAAGSRKGANVSIGGTGQGTTPDLIARVLIEKTKLQGVYVPFKGSGEYVAGVAGGQLTAGLVDYSGVKSQVDAKVMKLLLVVGDQRLKDHPNVPTTSESGLGDLNLFNPLRCIVVHRDTPPERLKILREAFRKAVDDPDFKTWATNTGLEARETPTRGIEERIRKTEDFGVPLLKRLNLYVD
jgi:tripartite-type tricarboxylate transporter receptor subunit TctC